MTRTFIQTELFSREWDKLGLTDDDLRMLEKDLLTHSQDYPVIKGTGRLRKMRIPLSEGKSGGARVCYVDFVILDTIYLVMIYPKSRKENLSQSEVNALRKFIEKIESKI